eukprot:6239698-Amphidinium_carterae.1
MIAKRLRKAVAHVKTNSAMLASTMPRHLPHSLSFASSYLEQFLARLRESLRNAKPPEAAGGKRFKSRTETCSPRTMTIQQSKDSLIAVELL